MAGSSNAVLEAQHALPFTRQDVERWKEERDALEQEAGAFQTKDMTKLRNMATGAWPSIDLRLIGVLIVFLLGSQNPFLGPCLPKTQI